SGDNKWEATVTLGSVAPANSPVWINVDAATVSLPSSLTVDGVVQDPNAAGLPLHKIGGGDLVFTNNNTYTGQTFIDEGTLEIRDSHALGSNVAGAGTVVADGATLQLSIDGKPDSITGTTNTLLVSEPLDITRRGVTVLG